MGAFSSPSLSPRAPLSKTGETLRQWSGRLYCHCPRQPPPQASLPTHHKHFNLITGDYQTLCSYCSDLPWVAQLHQKALFYWAVSLGCSPLCLQKTNVWGGDKPPKGEHRGGGHAAVNLDVTNEKAVADHYHKSDKR